MGRKRLAKGRCRSCYQAAEPGADLCRCCAAYQPCTTGIHVCGSDDVENWPVTLASFPMPEVFARVVFAQMMQEYEVDDHDVIVDLFVGGDQLDNFGIKRQMLDRVRRECEAAAQEAYTL